MSGRKNFCELAQRMSPESRARAMDLIDARDHVLAMRDVAAGNMPLLSEADMDAYLAAPDAAPIIEVVA